MTDQRTKISKIIFHLDMKEGPSFIDFRATGQMPKVWLAKNLADGKDLRD